VTKTSRPDITGSALSDEVSEIFQGLQMQVELYEPNVVVENIEKKSPFRHVAGKVVSAFFSVGCGVTAAAALSTLVAGPAFFVLAGILCVATTYANYKMTSNDVANIFVGGIKGLFQKNIVISTELNVAADKPPAQYLSLRKRIMLLGGSTLSLSFGTVFGALTYGSTLALVVAFTVLAGASFLLPPLGIILGVATFLTLSCLMVKAFSDLIKTENLKGKIKDMFTNMFSSEKDRAAGKSENYILAKKIALATGLVTLVGLTLGLIFLGQISTLGNCAREFGKILGAVTHASGAVVDVISKIVGLGFALLAQVPFILKTSMTPIMHLFSNKEVPEISVPASPHSETESPAPSWSEKFQHFPAAMKKALPTAALYIAATLSAAATSTIALAGKALGLTAILSGIGAFLNSFLGSVVNATLSAPVEAKDVVAITPHRASTTDIGQMLSPPAVRNAFLPSEEEVVSLPTVLALPSRQYSLFIETHGRVVANDAAPSITHPAYQHLRSSI
jgi:hypothetical protein